MDTVPTLDVLDDTASVDLAGALDCAAGFAAACVAGFAAGAACRVAAGFFTAGACAWQLPARA